MVANGLYRHFKGGMYEVIGVARHSEDNMEAMVVYRPIDTNDLWVRPISMWNEIVSRNGFKHKRFTKVEGELIE